MARIEAVPELADGGYWYHVAKEYLVLRNTGDTYLDELGNTQPVTDEVVVDFENILPEEIYRIRPALPALNAGFCAWYMTDGTIIVRSPAPIIGVDTISMSTADKLIAAGEATRPHGRIRGR